MTRSPVHFLEIETVLDHVSKLPSQVSERGVQTLCQVSKCLHYLLLVGESLGAVGSGHLSIIGKREN